MSGSASFDSHPFATVPLVHYLANRLYLLRRWWCLRGRGQRERWRRPAGIPDETLEPRWRIQDQVVDWCIRPYLKTMRNIAWRENRGSGLGANLPLAHAHLKLAFNQVEQFILAMVNMARDDCTRTRLCRA